jgi:hypothetical protein
MNCSPFDLRDYFLKELPDSEKRQVDAHVKVCQPCREELEGLSLTEASLLCLREEEIPQRIAFVSDKIFEPSPLRRWFSGFWASTARLGFASAAMLSTAIVVYSLHPVGQAAVPIAAVSQVPAQQSAIVQTVSDTNIQARIDAAVIKAVAVVQSRRTEEEKELLKDMASMRQRLILADGELQFDRKRSSLVKRANFDFPPEREAARDQDGK